jgi:GPH family glycoside/pentoside/hexuronide:cation symporter
VTRAPASLPAVAAAPAGLPGFALFAGMLACAGLPIYIHAPKFYVDSYGVSLAALGAVLAGLRLLDVVQDPLLGWLSSALRRQRGVAVGLGGGAMALAMLGLFAVPPPVAPLVWFALMLSVLFSAFSFLTITFYAAGVAKARALGPSGHVRVATWRETGALAGISAAAVAPTVLALGTDAPFAAFALGFAVLALAAVWAMRGEWSANGPVGAPTLAGFRTVLADREARRLLVVALVNAAPVAATSTLFLFFVEARLGAPGWEGALLLAFFLAAAVSAPLWGRAAVRFGTKRVLMAGMALSVASFAWAAALGEGDLLPFALICLASGAALGADMTLLAALFSARLARILPEAGMAFGLWTFVSKATLSVAALTLLPLLAAAGFEPGGESPASSLILLSALYGAVPCALKVVALGILAATPLTEP